MSKTEFIQRAVLAIMANPEETKNKQFYGTEFAPETIEHYIVNKAEKQWQELVSRGYFE